MQRIKSELDVIAKKALDSFPQRIFVENRLEYVDSIRDFFTLLLDNINFSSEVVANLEIYNSNLYILYVELNSNSTLLVHVIEQCASIIRNEYLIELDEFEYDSVLIKYNIILDYIIISARNIINFNFIPQNSAKDFLSLYEQYEAYGENEVLSVSQPCIKYANKENPHGYKSLLFKKYFKTYLDNNTKSVISQFAYKVDLVSFFILDTQDEIPTDKIKNILKISSDILKRSWGGEGLDLFNNLYDIYVISKHIGRAEKSLAGEMEIFNDFLAIYLSATYGNLISYENFFIEMTRNFFGDFNSIHYIKYQDADSIAGIKFLSKFNQLKSFNEAHLGDKLYDYFNKGLHNRDYIIGSETRNNFIIKILREINRNLLTLGDIVKNIGNILDENGHLQHYEGLGSIKYVIELMKEVFPDVNSRRFGDKYTGLLGAVSNLAYQFERFSEILDFEIIETNFTNHILDWLSKVKNKLEIILSIISVTGYKQGQFIPNLNFEPSPRTQEDIKKFFIRKGYSEEESDKISRVKSMRELIEGFSYKMDSSDIKSFLKGYDFLHGVFLIGGEKELETIIEYLSRPTENNIRQIFTNLIKRKDKYLKWDTFKYGELIGTLLNIYAADKQDLKGIFNVIRAQDASLGSALDIVYNMLKETDINVNLDLDYTALVSLTSKLGVYENRLDLYCEDLKKENPLVLRKILRLIDSSIGFADMEQLIGLFDDNIGITPRELANVLNIKNNPGYSLLGGMLSGLEGGLFTELTRNVYLSGLGIYFSTKARKISGAIENDRTVSIRDMYVNLERLNLLLKIFEENFKLSETSKEVDKSFDIDTIINASNRDSSIFSNIFSYLSPGNDTLSKFRVNLNSLKNILFTSLPKEPPGLGNSPLVIKTTQGVISPEIGYFLSTTNRDKTVKFSDANYLNPNRFVKVNLNTQDSDYLEPITLEEELDNNLTLLYSLRDDFNTHVVGDKLSASQEKIVQEGNLERFGASTFYSQDTLIDIGEEKDPIDYCVGMGSNRQLCEQRYKSYMDAVCPTKFRSFNPTVEAYVPQSSANNLPVSRPWGFISDLTPSNSSFNFYKSPPRYWNNLDYNTYLNNNFGEPLDIVRPISLGTYDFDLTFTDLFHHEYIRQYGMPYIPTDCHKGSIIERNICLNIINKKIDPIDERIYPPAPLTVYIPYDFSLPLPLEGFNYIKDYLLGKLNITYKEDKKFILIVLGSYNKIKEFKFTNTGIESWCDTWIDEGRIISPHIEEINLSGSPYLKNISISNSSESLRILKANNCPELAHVNVSSCDKLEYISLNNCVSLTKINFGKIPNVKHLSLKGCNLDEIALEDILSSFYPTQSPSKYISFGKIDYGTILDLRGTFIPWENQKIASKIRLMLANNFKVIWDNNPPGDIIPVQYYRTLGFN